MRKALRELTILGVVLLASGVARAGEVEVSGLVAYREQLMLPPAAVTTVSLVRQDAPDGDPVAEVVIGERRTPPIPFSLTYDSGAIDPTSDYALDARITLEDQLLFAVEAPLPVADPTSSMKTSIVVRLQRPD